MLVRVGNKSDMRVGVPNCMACWVSSAYQVAFGVILVGDTMYVMTCKGSPADDETDCREGSGVVIKSTNRTTNSSDKSTVMRVSDCRLESLKARRSAGGISVALGIVTGGLD